MYEKNIFTLILLICLITIYFLTNTNEHFNTNLFFQPIPNIFLGDNYYNYKLNKPDYNLQNQTEPINKITFDAFLYSKPTSQKIICLAHTNRADCWEDNVNNCQWVHKIDGGSYCDVGLPLWP